MAGLLAIVACVTPGVVLDSQMPLHKNQPFEGTQQNMDYRLDYRYVFLKGIAPDADQINFSGKLTPRRGLVTFSLRLHLLDASGKVLATEVLYAPGAGQGAGRSSIIRKINIPPNAVRAGFSHFARDRPILY